MNLIKYNIKNFLTTLLTESSNGEVSNGHKAKDHQEKEPSESYHLTNGDLQPTKKITMDPLSNMFTFKLLIINNHVY